MTSPSTDRRYGLSSGLAIKAPCRAASTSALTLSGEQTVDGIALITGDRCLVKNQTNAIDNGIYVVDTGSWTRDADCDGARDLVTGSMIKITAGSSNGGNIAELMTTGTIVVGSTPLTFLMRAGTLAGISAFGGQLIQAVDAAAGRVVLGFTTFGSTVVQAASADSAGLVDKTTAQTIAGQKTFSTRPIVGTAAVGTSDASAASTALVANTIAGILVKGRPSGLTLSTAGSSATMTISAGKAVDSTSAIVLSLASAIAKTTAAWAVGTAVGGKLSAAAIANNTWYYFFEIYRADTGVVDVGFDVSPITPTLPANYTHSRYIGAGLTNGSAQWVAFTQVGDDFFWKAPILDFTGASSTTSSLLTCSIPRGRKMKGWFASTIVNLNSGSNYTYFSDPDNTTLAISPTNISFGINTAATTVPGGQINCWSNTSAQIRHVESDVGALTISTLGWTDTRDGI